MPDPIKRDSIEIVIAESGHIPQIASRLRASDRMEVWASNLASPEEALTASFALSPYCWTAKRCDTPVAMFGAAAVSPISSTGIPWLLATDQLMKNRREFLRLSRPRMSLLQQRFRLLTNWVDARNHQSIRWLEWLGFQIQPPRPHGPFNLPFHLFELRSDTNV